MCGVFVAKTTELFNFHTVWIVLFFFCCVVIALFAVCTCQGYFCAHNGTSFQIKWGSAPNPLVSFAYWPGGLPLCGTCYAGVCPAAPLSKAQLCFLRVRYGCALCAQIVIYLHTKKHRSAAVIKYITISKTMSNIL